MICYECGKEACNECCTPINLNNKIQELNYRISMCEANSRRHEFDLNELLYRKRQPGTVFSRALVATRAFLFRTKIKIMRIRNHGSKK